MYDRPRCVFVSSRMQELADARHAIKAALDALKVDGWVYEEDAGARSQSIRQTYLDELAAADRFARPVPLTITHAMPTPTPSASAARISAPWKRPRSFALRGGDFANEALDLAREAAGIVAADEDSQTRREAMALATSLAEQLALPADVRQVL